MKIELLRRRSDASKSKCFGQPAPITRGREAAPRAKRPLRDPEDRIINEADEVQRREKAMDKTLADSFPASDPPGWLP